MRPAEPATPGAIAWAAFLLAALTLLGALSASVEGGDRRVCQSPHEAAAEDGWTTAVACGRLEQAGPSVRGPALLLFGGRIDINTSDARTLDVLPGIGAARAATILGARAERGFESLSDLERIPGIGPRTVDGLRGWARAGREEVD